MCIWSYRAQIYTRVHTLVDVFVWTYIVLYIISNLLDSDCWQWGYTSRLHAYQPNKFTWMMLLVIMKKTTTTATKQWEIQLAHPFCLLFVKIYLLSIIRVVYFEISLRDYLVWPQTIGSSFYQLQFLWHRTYTLDYWTNQKVHRSNVSKNINATRQFIMALSLHSHRQNQKQTHTTLFVIIAL